MKDIDGFVLHMKCLSKKPSPFTDTKVSLEGLSYEDWKFYIRNYNEISRLNQSGVHVKTGKDTWVKELYEPITVDDIKTVKEKLGILIN